MPVRRSSIPRLRACGRRVGYTLVEMLLVLSVLLALAFISWPMMEGVFSDYQLRRTAETMTATLAGARTRAIDAGGAYQFRYEPGGKRWFAIPFEQDDLSGGAGDANTAATSSDVLSGEIPDPLQFRSLDPNAAGEQLESEALGALPEAALWNNVTWSLPVLFFADGSSVATTFDVADDKGAAYRISIRDLTGAARVEKQAAPSAPQLQRESK